MFGQLGRATSYTSNGETFSFTRKPSYYQLAAWDDARRKEPLIKQGLEYLVLAIVSKIGSYSHPDPEIDDFVQANIENKIKGWIANIAMTALWSGFGVSEINYTNKVGPGGIPQTWFDDVINFHPLQVTLMLNDYGVVKDGDRIMSSPFKSGIYVPAPYTAIQRPAKNREYMGSLVRLPKSKRVYVALNNEGNNPYGRSILESVLPYHLFKEAYRDMMTVALDRYGTPLVYAIVPPLDTKEMIEEPDGTVRPKTLQEMTVEQMQNLSNESVLVFTQISKDQPVQLGALTTGNNFSDAFQQAMDMCDLNMLHGLGIPNLLIKDNHSRMGSGGASERQLEIFNAFVGSLFDLIVGAFVEQAIAQLIQFNFDPKKNPKAYNAGKIQKKPTRVNELKVVTESIKALTELGFINPTNPVDFRYVRELIDLPGREPDPLPDNLLPFKRQERIETKRGSDATSEENVKVPNPAAKHALEGHRLETQKQMQQDKLDQADVQHQRQLEHDKEVAKEKTKQAAKKPPAKKSSTKKAA